MCPKCKRRLVPNFTDEEWDDLESGGRLSEEGLEKLCDCCGAPIEWKDVNINEVCICGGVMKRREYVDGGRIRTLWVCCSCDDEHG